MVSETKLITHLVFVLS